MWGTDQEQKSAPIWARFLFAQFVTSTSETLAYPLDTIRRRLMMESGKARDQRMYKGTLDCGSRILAKEGVTGFFKGNLSNFWRSIGSSIVLVLYDELQKWVNHHGY
jgi:solute carrier family 25 (mitochondrial adenine nucleotide translocator), member 4/5/6/31